MITNSADAKRLVEIVDQFLAERRAGRAPSKRDLVDRHPDVAEELERCLSCLELVEQSIEDEQSETGRSVIGGVLGDFRIIREVGRGGMGVVYEAEQISLSRRVALKVLPFASVFDDRQLQRFKNEAQAAALLHHPNIVPVHAVGQERGVHYFAMQFIEGRSLAEIIDELRKGDPEPPQPLSAITKGKSTQSAEYCRGVARIAIQAAEALAHAHERGVIHRDVKPGNLMVDPLGRLWVTDFGLAAFRQGDTNLTMTGDLLGTIRYMSPEQVRGNRAPIDQRTDVYSLGITLYELLTLKPAFRAESVEETLRSIANDEPSAPRRLNPAIPMDLETIVLKAIAKEPSDRYSDMAELSSDLTLLLEHRPIRAKRPAWTASVQKWAIRNRAWVAAGVAGLLLAFVVSIVSLVTIAGREKEAVAARDASAESLRTAIAAIEKSLLHVGADLMNTPGTTELKLKLFREARDLFADLAERHAGDPELIRTAAVAHQQMGRILLRMGQADEAIAAYDEASRLYDLIGGDVAFALMQSNAGIILWQSGRGADARPRFESAIARVGGREDIEALEARAAAWAGMWVTTDHDPNSKAGDKRGATDAALAIREKIVKARGTRSDRINLAFALHHSALAAEHIDPDLHRERTEEALQLGTQLHDEDPTDVEVAGFLAVALTNYGIGRWEAGSSKEAVEMLTRAERVLSRLAAAHPKDGTHRYSLAKAKANLCEFIAATGDLEQALRKGEEAHELLETLASESFAAPPPDELLATVEVELARCHARTDDERALALLGKALERRLAIGGPKPSGANAYAARARIYARLGRHEDANRDWSSGLAVLKARLDESAVSHARYAWRLVRGPDPASWNGELAMQHARRAVEIGSGDRAGSWRALALVHYRNGDFGDAADALGRVERIEETEDPRTLFLQAMTLHRLGKPGSKAAYDQAMKCVGTRYWVDLGVQHLRQEAEDVLEIGSR